jgi:short-subunit dehydrogenase
MAGFVERYGPWAVVAGASEGIGASFSKKLAARGVNLVLVARRPAPLEDLAAELRQKHGIEVKVQPLDLGSPDVVAGMSAATEDLDVGLVVYNAAYSPIGLDVGLVVYNAAYSPIGAFLDIDVEEHLQATDVNVYGPLRLSHYFGRRLVERGKGGIILMCSMSGFQGTSMIANYAATKAYDAVLATLTPSYESTIDRIPTKGLARPMLPDEVTEQALVDLGQRPIGVSGRRNRLASVVIGRLLPRRAAVEIISKETERLFR